MRLALLATLLLWAHAHAQDDAPAVPAAEGGPAEEAPDGAAEGGASADNPGEPTDAADLALYELWTSGKPIAARTAAEERLAGDPESFVARYVLGHAYYEEGDLSRAGAELEHAERIWQTEYADAPTNPWQLHAQLLLTLVEIAEGRSDSEEVLRWLDAHDAAYDPDQLSEHAWPLMKLGRHEEGRGWARRGIETGEQWPGEVGRNALCAIATDEGDREGQWEACSAARAGLSPTSDAVPDLMNAAGAALATLRFSEAGALLEEATRGAPIGAANPWIALAWYHLAAGNGTEAVAAVRGMQDWRTRQPPKYADESRAAVDEVLAAVFYMAGDSPRALSTITRALDFPDRHGTNSGTAEGALGANSLLRLAVRRLHERGLHEAVQARGLFRRLGYALLRRAPSWEAWVDRSAVTATLTDARRLQRTLRAYTEGNLTTPWLVGDLVPVLGPGVVEAELARARTLDTDPRFDAYADALALECAWVRGDERGVLRLAPTVISGLPQYERLLRARVAALTADAAWSRGDPVALSSYELALALDPSVLRRLGLALPATVTSSSGIVAQEAAAILARSPSLTSAPGAFRVSVEGTNVLRACLSSPSGARLGCSETPVPTAPSVKGDGGEGAEDTDATEEIEPPDHATTAAADFHRVVFSMPLGISGTALGSLDGTNVVRTERARREMEALLEGVKVE